MELILRPPTAADEAGCRALPEQLLADDFEFLLADGSWGELPSTVAREAAGIDLAPGRVPADFLRAEVDGQVVGRVSIRHALNDFLRTIDGHIGYAVGPDFRRHGCATEILRQSVTRLNALGVDRVLVTCDDDNIASARTIERCGGVLENIWQPSTDPGNEPVKPKRRYWIG